MRGQIRTKTDFPLAKVYGLLEPGPVVLLTTALRGRTNVMTLSWHTMVEFEPPLVAIVLSPADHSFEMLRKSRACVLNIPTVELAPKVVACGNVSGRNVDKFTHCGLTQRPATLVEAPLIDECCASLESRVVDTRMVNRYGMFMLEVVKAWATNGAAEARTLHHRGHGVFMVAGRSLRLPSNMP